MKIALVHDDFTQSGGAENLFADIAQIYPKAPIYTALINKEVLPPSIDIGRVRTSFMQKIPFASKFFKLLLPLYPIAFESFDFSNFDIVISSSTRFGKSIITKPKTIHICYINSTPRFLWHENSKNQYMKNWQEKLTKFLFNWLKRYDLAASARPDFFFANSQNVARAVKKDYGREADTIYPFADTGFFTPPTIKLPATSNQLPVPYFLVVSRLAKWKRVDLAIKACSALNKNLIIVGTGPDEKRLRKLAQLTINNQQSTIEFEGRIPRETLRKLYQNAHALIVTQEEDFGISIVEAQASGIPVIAFDKGGQKEIIVAGKTGLFFETQSQKSLEGAIIDSIKVKWDVSACRKNSLRFSKEVFVREINQAIADKIKVF